MRWSKLFLITSLILGPIQVCEASNPPVPSLGETNRPPLNQTKDKNEKTKHYQDGTNPGAAVVEYLNAANTDNQAAQTTNKGDRESTSDRRLFGLTDNWWIVILTGCLVIVGVVQAGLFIWQLRLIKRSLNDSTIVAKAAEISAEAALAALDRPWLVLEGFKLNEIDWLGGKGMLRASFKISNYGKAPAIIKGICVTHFRGLHHHNGRPPQGLPSTVLDFPNAESFTSFVTGHKYNILDESNEIFLDINFIVGGGDSTETLYFPCHPGGGIVTHDIKSINPITLTESYLLGVIYYEIPGQTPEIIHFCYKGNNHDSFGVFNDYAPYNERKKANLDK